MKDKKMLEEICEGCTGYCTLKEIMLNSGMDDRTVMQMKIIEKFKYDWSKQEGRDLGWEEASRRYVDLGYAKAFAKHWHEHAHVNEIYRKLI